MIRYYPIVPIAAPRQSRSHAWKPSPPVVRYHAYRDEVRLQQVQIPQPFSHVIFILPMSESWSRKKRDGLRGMPHQYKPDRDNLEKALLDSVFGEDCTVWDGRTTKLWGDQGAIIVSRDSIPIHLPFPIEEYERYISTRFA